MVTRSSVSASSPTQAKLEAARAEHKARKAKATVVEPTKLDEIHAIHEDDSVESLADRAQAAFDALAAKLGAATPARYMCSAILALATACGLGWLVGHVLTWLMIAVALATGSLFLVYLVGIIGLIASAYAGYKISGVIFDYVVTKRVDAHWQATKDAVGSFFSRKPQVIQG